MKRHSRVARYAEVLLILVATFLVHGNVLDRFWLADDPQVLLHAIRHGPAAVAADEEIWQELSTSNFTPLVTWSFDADLALFGLDPLPFYLHQLLVLAVIAIALRFLLLVVGIGSRVATAGALIFLIAPPTIHVAGSLMTRHYAEGLLAAIVSVTAWLIACKSSGARRWWLLISVGSYFLSIMAKEVYLLLPLVHLGVMPERIRWNHAIRSLVPYGAVLGVYMVWRYEMLGSAGGYGGDDRWSRLIEVSTAWAKQEPFTLLWLVTLVAICMGNARHFRRASLRILLIVVALFAPLTGIGDAVEPRHLFFPSAALVGGAMFGIAKNLQGPARMLSFLLILALSGLAGGVTWKRELARSKQMEAEGRYVWEMGSDAAVLLAGSPAWYLDGLAELDRIWRNESSPVVRYSPLGIVAGSEIEQFVTFTPQGAALPRTTREIEIREDLFLPTARLEIEIARDRHALRWDFGPRCDCEWRFYSYPEYQMFVVEPEGERVVPRPRVQQWFRIERRDASGRWTLSPPLPLPAEGDRTRWKRE